MTKVSVIGSISMDLVTRTNRVPNAGETVFGEDFAMVPGGKGANQAVAFARLSPNEVSMIGAVGKDAFGESILQNFKENAVLFENVGTVPQTTGIAQITLYDDDNRIIITPYQANQLVSISENIQKHKLASKLLKTFGRKLKKANLLFYKMKFHMKQI